MATGRMAKRIKFPPWWFVEILGVTTKLESIVDGRTTNKNNVLRKLTRKWSGRLHDYVRWSVRLRELRERKNWMAIATLVQSFPIKEREWRRKGAKKKKQERQGWGSERVQRHAFPWRGGGRSNAVTGVKPKVRYTRGKVAARRAVSTPIGPWEIRANERRPVERETPSRTVVRTDASRRPNLRYDFVPHAFRNIIFVLNRKYLLSYFAIAYSPK